MRRIHALVLAALLATPASAGLITVVAAAGGSTFQWMLVSGAHNLPTTANTYYGLPFQHANTGFSTTGEWVGSVTMPSAGVLSDFAVLLGADIGGVGNDAAFTLMRDTTGIGTAADSVITCTITGGAGSETTCSDADTLSVDVGDRLVMKIVITGTPGANIKTWWHFKFDPTTDNHTVMTMNTLAGSAASARYHTVNGFFTGQTGVNEPTVRTIWPTAGTVTACACASDTDLSGTMTRAFRLFVNGTGQADVTCTLNDTAQEATDTGSVSIAAGDLLTIEDTPTNSATSATRTACGFTFVPTVSGEFVLAGQYNSGLNVGANRYLYPGDGHNSSPSATEATGAYVVPQTLTMKAFYASVQNDPATTASWLFTPFEAGGATADNCTISAGGALTCSDLNDVTYESGNSFSVESDPSATAPAASGNASVSMVFAP